MDTCILLTWQLTDPLFLAIRKFPTEVRNQCAGQHDYNVLKREHVTIFRVLSIKCSAFEVSDSLSVWRTDERKRPAVQKKLWYCVFERSNSKRIQFFFSRRPFIHSMLPCVCSVIDHRGRQNVVRTSVTHPAAPRVPLFCSYHILSSVIYYWADARQHGIYLLIIILSVLTGMPQLIMMLLSLLCIRVSGSCWYYRHLSVISISWSLQSLQWRYTAALLCLEMFSVLSNTSHADTI